MTTSSPRALLLEVLRLPDGLRASLSPLGPSWLPTLQSYLSHQVDFAEVDRLCYEMRVQLGRSNQRGQLDESCALELRKLGLLLFDELLPAPIKEKLRAAEGLDLMIRADEALSDVPWELLHTGQRFLALQVNLGRLIQSAQPLEVAAPRPLGQLRDVLILADPGGDLDAAYEEGIALRDHLDGLLDTRVTLRSSEVSRADVRENLREFDLLHFAGHAQVQGQGQGWLMSDGRFTAQDIDRLRGGRPFPSLVFANACGSGRQRSALLQARASHSLAHAFLQSGVRHFIGAHWDVPDEVAGEFALHFYRALTRGAPIGAALRTARLAMSVACGEGALLWGSYCLYGDPGFVYFPQEEALDEDDFELTILEPPHVPVQAPGVYHEMEVPVSELIRPKAPPLPSAPLRGQELALEPSTFTVEPGWLRSAALVALCAALCGAVAAAGAYGWEHLGTPAQATAQHHSLRATGPALPPPDVDAGPAAVMELEPDSFDILPGEPLRVQAQVEVFSRDGTRARPLHAMERVRSGESMQLRLEPNRDAHLVVLLLDERAQPQLLYPHPAAQAGSQGLLKEGQGVTLPGQQERWTMARRVGVETLLVLASAEPVEDLDALLDELRQTYGASGGSNLLVQAQGPAQQRLTPLQERALQKRQRRLSAVHRVARAHKIDSIEALTWLHTR